MILLGKYKKKISQAFAAKQVNHNWCFLRRPKFKVTSFRDFVSQGQNIQTIKGSATQ